MPQFDESFVSDCALAESRNVFSYSLDRGHQLYYRRKLKSPRFFVANRPRIVVKNVIRYSAISSPSTPNSSLSSQSNLVGTSSPNTPSPATPTQQPGTPLGTPHTPSTPGAPGSSGHKNSLKGTKLARRARSFKDDLIEKISSMRTPTNTLGRSHSPHSPRSKHGSNKPPPTAEEVARSSQSLEVHVKDISNALKHFKDVILKKKLEVLPGNATVILETVASMFSVIQSNTLNENSAVLRSATQQVYQTLGKLIKLCDEVMLSEENGDCASLSNDNVKEVVDLLETAVRQLVMRAQEKLKEKEENAFKYSSNAPDVIATVGPNSSNNHLMRPPVEVAGQRTSLPDITLTPKERDILEKTNSNPLRASHSTESILRDTSPPPKPPLPIRSSNPPPLPPKRRSHQHNQHSNNISINSDLDCCSELSLNYAVDHLSVRSRSPDENSSQCSQDSALNHSREEEELKMLGLEQTLDQNLLEDDVTTMFPFKSQVNASGQKIETSKAEMGIIAQSTAAGIFNMATAASTLVAGGKPEMHKTALNNRHSNESGYVSMKSYRVSKQSSDYSFQTSSKSSNSEIAFTSNDGSEFHHQQQHQQQLHHQQQQISSFTSSNTTNSTTINSSIKEHHSSTSSKIFSSTSSSISGSVNEENTILINRNIASPELFVERERGVLSKTYSLEVGSSENVETVHAGVLPPALPPKSIRAKERQYSQSDEVDDSQELAELREHNHHLQQQHHQHIVHQWQSKHHSLMESQHTNLSMAGSCSNIGLELPPPLPIKKKHILAYMEICSSTRSGEAHRHTMHVYNTNRNISHSQTMNNVSLPKESHSPEHDAPPALPPKSYKQRKPTGTPPTIITTPPPSPKPSHLSAEQHTEGMRPGRVLSQGSEQMSTVCEELSDLTEEEQMNLHHSHKLPNDNISETNNSWNNNHHNNHNSNEIVSRGGVGMAPLCTPDAVNEEDEGIDVVLENHNYNDKKINSHIMLKELDIIPYLVFKKENDDGPDIKGGYIEALIVHASRIQKVSDNAFSEAFITTFRTFIQPIDVIEKLTHRYTFFFCQMNDQKQKAAKETFSLLVRVVNDLTSTDLTSPLLTLLVEFVYQLVCSGELYQAKVLRNKIVDKVTLYKELKQPPYQPEMFVTTAHQPSLLDLKSVEIAEQMTLLDADLFQKIEIPEVLLFAKEQCEEKSPNLNKFTEHFNKMSYWARSKILMLSDAKEREKHVIKFIKIMKHLRKMNNYNSYLALLSALDSAPIRRLEWQKNITDGLKEYCTLIDSSSSFRVYRQALSETNPPCIPYIGLVLQDLTFVHVGNPDYLKDGVINFSKRWQQYHIIVNMKRFKKCDYPFKRNDRIIRFFGNFEDYLGEEEMWQISENIKPRGKRTTH